MKQRRVYSISPVEIQSSNMKKKSFLNEASFYDEQNNFFNNKDMVCQFLNVESYFTVKKLVCNIFYSMLCHMFISGDIKKHIGKLQLVPVSINKDMESNSPALSIPMVSSPRDLYIDNNYTEAQLLFGVKYMDDMALVYIDFFSMEVKGSNVEFCKLIADEFFKYVLDIPFKNVFKGAIDQRANDIEIKTDIPIESIIINQCKYEIVQNTIAMRIKDDNILNTTFLYSAFDNKEDIKNSLLYSLKEKNVICINNLDDIETTLLTLKDIDNLYIILDILDTEINEHYLYSIASFFHKNNMKNLIIFTDDIIFAKTFGFITIKLDKFKELSQDKQILYVSRVVDTKDVNINIIYDLVNEINALDIDITYRDILSLGEYIGTIDTKEQNRFKKYEEKIGEIIRLWGDSK